MALGHGAQGVLVLAGGDVSGYFNQVDTPAERAMHDVTCFQGNVAAPHGHRYFPGLLDGSVNLDGFFDDANNATLDTQFTNAYNEPFVFGPQGLANGSRCVFGMAWQKSYKPSSKQTDMVTHSVEFKSAGLGVLNGRSFGPLAAYAGTLQLDRGAAAVTASRRLALIVQATTLPDARFRISALDHSVDASTWVSLLSALSPSTTPSWGPTGTDAPGDVGRHGMLVHVDTAQTINRHIRLTLVTDGSTAITGNPVQAAVSVF